MVFDLLGQSIYDWLKDNSFCPFPPNQVQHFARQLLTSVACKPFSLLLAPDIIFGPYILLLICIVRRLFLFFVSPASVEAHTHGLEA